jgi:hypothetical protein
VRKPQHGPSPDLSHYKVWADLKLPIYVTTNYDGFLEDAIETNKLRKPRTEVCRWKNGLPVYKTFADPNFEPHPGTPLIYYLFGHVKDPESILVTEKDYLDFLVNVKRTSDALPGLIELAFTSTYLLFVGYRLFDLDFWVLLQTLSQYLKINVNYGPRPHVCVQLVDLQSDARRRKAQEYFGEFCGLYDMRIYAGSCNQFVDELSRQLTHGMAEQ